MRVVASFSKPEQAHLLRAHLEGSGIAAFVRDDHTVTADWALSNAIGGVKVEVAEEDFDAAVSLMAAFTPPAVRDPGGKRTRGFERYIKIFGGCFVLSVAFLGWRSGFSEDGVVMMLVFGVSLSACVAGFCALLDL
jgi:hypothetical protein